MRKSGRIQRIGIMGAALSLSLLAGAAGAAQDERRGGGDPADAVKTESPIKHVIILIGENRGLDHTFGVYKPKGKGQTISNLLSKGIVNEDGSPGPNFAQAQQFSVARAAARSTSALPTSAKSPYGTTNQMPQPNTNGAPTAQSDTGAPFKTIAEASDREGHRSGDLDILTTGFTGLPTNILDTRVPGAGTLRTGRSRCRARTSATTTTPVTPRTASTRTGSRTIAASPTPPRPTTRLPQRPVPLRDGDLFARRNKSQGNSMGFYNAEQEQAPILKMLADRFTLSDNFHQSFHGRHRRQPLHARHRRCGVLERRQRQSDHAAGEPDRQPEPASGHRTTSTRPTTTSATALTSSSPACKPIVDYLESLPYAARAELPAQPLLHAQQHQSGLPAERCAASRGARQPPAVVRSRPSAMR